MSATSIANKLGQRFLLNATAAVAAGACRRQGTNNYAIAASTAAVVKVMATRASSTLTEYTMPHVIIVDKNGRVFERKNTSLLGPSKKYPLPGDVRCAALSANDDAIGIISPTSSSSTPASTLTGTVAATKNEVITTGDATQRFASLTTPEVTRNLFHQTRGIYDYKPPSSAGETASSDAQNSKAGHSKFYRRVQMSAVECPRLLRLELVKIFEDDDLASEDHITLLNMTLKDRSINGDDVDRTEIDESLFADMFIDAAVAICEGLRSFDSWADFINPKSGLPHFGRFPTSKANPILDHDANYEHVGFQVENLGACKVIRQQPWSGGDGGGGKFVGTIFTDISMRSDLLTKLLVEVNRSIHSGAAGGWNDDDEAEEQE